MPEPLRITRKQLKDIIGEDSKAIRSFEELFMAVDGFIQSEVQTKIEDFETRITALENP